MTIAKQGEGVSMGNGDIAQELDWPPAIPQPLLPVGYQWICLRQAFGMKTARGEYPWWIRLSWTVRNGKNRILKMPGYFDTAEFAVHRAVDEARKHAERQRNKSQ